MTCLFIILHTAPVLSQKTSASQEDPGKQHKMFATQSTLQSAFQATSDPINDSFFASLRRNHWGTSADARPAALAPCRVRNQRASRTTECRAAKVRLPRIRDCAAPCLLPIGSERKPRVAKLDLLVFGVQSTIFSSAAHTNGAARVCCHGAGSSF